MRRSAWMLLAVWAGWAVAEEARPVVVVSIPPQAWLAKRLSGEAAHVESLLSAGTNPHTFEPSSKQVRQLAGAAVYLTLGMPFERTLVSRAAGLNPALVVAPADAGVTKLGATHDHRHGEPGHVCSAEGGDPHIWLSPRLFGAMASNTAAALSAVLPARREAIAASLAETVALIGRADRELRAAVDASASKTWAVYHPSWSYFAADYGLTLLVIEKDGKTPPARHLAEVIGAARAAGVRVVFTEAQYDPRPAQTVARQVGARLETLDPLQEDWAGLMSGLAEKLRAGGGR